MSFIGEWSLENGTKVMRPELYSDMRRPQLGTWEPDTETIVENLNQTGYGCLQVTSNGLYHLDMKEACEEERYPSCEYKGL